MEDVARCLGIHWYPVSSLLLPLSPLPPPSPYPSSLPLLPPPTGCEKRRPGSLDAGKEAQGESEISKNQSRTKIWSTSLQRSELGSS